jgi:hypothetical protein
MGEFQLHLSGMLLDSDDVIKRKKYTKNGKKAQRIRDQKSLVGSSYNHQQDKSDLIFLDLSS